MIPYHSTTILLHKNYQYNMTNKKNRYNNQRKQDSQQTQTKSIANEEELANQCLHLHELLSNRTNKLRAMKDNELAYLLSTKWLQDWKDYVGYDQLVGDKQDKPKKDKKYGRSHPGRINADITAPANEVKEVYELPKQMEQYTYLTELAAEKRTKDDDYIAVTPDIWEAFLGYYTGDQIRRPVRITKSSTYYDGDLLKCDVVIADLQDEELEEKIKKTKKANYSSLFPNDKFVFSNLWTIKELKAFLSQYCKIVYGTQRIRLWKGLSYIATNPLIEGIVESIKNKTFLIKGRQLKEQRYEGKDIDEYIKSTHTLVVEIGEFLKPDESEEEDMKGYCEECVVKKPLTISCVCKEVVYCTNKCRTNDQTFHYNTCERAFDSDDDEEFDKVSLELPPVAGLENLGNTCYMNSTIQALLSLPSLALFFSANQYVQQMNEKQFAENKCRFLSKFSKTIKALIQFEDAYTPWPLKSQIDYNLTPFKGDKQHDANDFLLNFINVLNDHLKKTEDKAYNPILQPLVGEFYSKVLCPNCKGISQNNEIFLQISLPIKSRVQVKNYNYIVVESLNEVRKGKSKLSDSWKEMKADVDAKTSLVCLMKDNSLTVVDQLEETPQKVSRAKGDLVFLKNVFIPEGEVPFSFGLVTIKLLMGNKMKSSYGIPSILTVRDQVQTLGTFWLQIIRHFFASNQEIVLQAEQMEKDYLTQIEEAVKEEAKKEKQTKGEKKQGQEQIQDKQSELCRQIASSFNNKLKLFAEKIGIDVFVHDFKRSRNTCKFCGKKCSNCDLPKIFDTAFHDFFADKYNEVRFEIYLRTIIETTTINQDRCASGQPTIHDCLQLFAEPEELDEENAWYCDKCDSMALALKELHVKVFPALLVLHLNRFKTVDNRKVKNSEPILYNATEEFGGKEYRLLASIIHEGSMEGGHYWCIARRNEDYYIFNDSKVSKTDKVFNKNAYILIYQLI